MGAYTLDPYKISMDRFYKLTVSKKLVPSRIMLLESIEERFGIIKNLGIENLGELLKILKSKQKLQTFASKSGLSPSYLVLLKREAGSYIARPFPLSDFPGIPHEYVEVLKSKGIRQTRVFFESVQTRERQMELSHQTGIPIARLQELFALSDLSRITGIGGVFARIIYEAGVKSVEQFVLTSAGEQYQKYTTIIRKQRYPAGHFTVEDIQYCIDYATVILECRKLTNPS